MYCVDHQVVSSVLADDAKGAESVSLLPGLGGAVLLFLFTGLLLIHCTVCISWSKLSRTQKRS